MRNIEPPIVPKTMISPFSDRDLDNLIVLTSGSDFTNIRNRAIVLTFTDSGVRLAEMASIKIVDYDIDHQTLRVFGKGRKERIVPIGKRTQRAVFEYLVIRDRMERTGDVVSSPCMWVSSDLKAMTRYGIQSQIQRLTHRAGVQVAKHGPHSFRHTTAHKCRENGMSVEEIQNLLGHASPETTRVYLGNMDGTPGMIAAHRKASPVDNWFKDGRK